MPPRLEMSSMTDSPAMPAMQKKNMNGKAVQRMCEHTLADDWCACCCLENQLMCWWISSREQLRTPAAIEDLRNHECVVIGVPKLSKYLRFKFGWQRNQKIRTSRTTRWLPSWIFDLHGVVCSTSCSHLASFRSSKLHVDYRQAHQLSCHLLPVR